MAVIYSHYVRNTAITFEYDVPSSDEFGKRLSGIQEKYPWLVLEEDERIRGYAYASPFKDRAAYDHACELSIYLDTDAKGKGYGRMLYDALETRPFRMGITNLYACISLPEKEDEYLTFDSVRFHEHMGFVLCGTFHQCGYKFDTWYHMVWMEKMIAGHSVPMRPLSPYGETV